MTDKVITTTDPEDELIIPEEPKTKDLSPIWSQYKSLYQKDVPARFKNDESWLVSKIEKKLLDEIKEARGESRIDTSDLPERIKWVGEYLKNRKNALYHVEGYEVVKEGNKFYLKR